MKLKLKKDGLKDLLGLGPEDVIEDGPYNKAIFSLAEIATILRERFSLDKSVVLTIEDKGLEIEIEKEDERGVERRLGNVLINLNEGSIWPKDDEEAPLEPVEVPNYLLIRTGGK